MSIPLVLATCYFLLPLLALADPIPTPWPLQFHSILMVNRSTGLLQINDLWYDWPNGRNFNIIQLQLGKKLYDLEWDNGTSYYYTLDDGKECETKHFPVGILRPNWLEGANYLGQVEKDGFLCNVWEKVDFIWYYEDVATKRPVFWAFYSVLLVLGMNIDVEIAGMTAHVMTFEVGKVLDDPNWQAPVYCFEEEAKQEAKTPPLLESPFGLMRDHVPRIPMLI